MSAPILATIQQAITRYVMPIMVTIANLSNLLSILIFLQKNHRASSCSIYLVFAAVFSITSINWAIIPTINALNNPPDPFSQSLVLCRLRGYILQVANNLFRTFLILACADRFAMSSSSAGIRAWATKKIAWRIVAITILVWLLIPFHIIVWETIEKSKCSAFGTYATFYTTYLFIVIFTPLCLMSLLGFLTRPEVIVYLILTSPYPFMVLYTTVTANVTDKSATRLQIESFTSFITNSFLQYLNSGSCLFIYLSTSRTFRLEVKKLILNRGRDGNNSSVPGRTTEQRPATIKQTQRTLPT